MTHIEDRYKHALDYLYSFVDYSLKRSSDLAMADFNLDRMFALMEELGNPHQKYRIIHVAGTKGKGSVCALCASALRAAGYRTGLYTSPHLLDFTERIQVDGQPISRGLVADLIQEVKPIVARIPKLTTFEITTAVGLLGFARQGVEAAVIEVGVGGRLDATNIVTPAVSVITSLSYDHTALLGDTLAEIALEKAGIIKPWAPIVSSPQKGEALEVLERVAKTKESEFVLVGRDVEFERLTSSLDGQRLRVASPISTPPGAIDITIPLLGLNQVENAATAYAALQAGGLGVSGAAIQKGFAEVHWPARFQVVRREPPVILDSAHNADSFERLRDTLEEHFPGRPVTLVFGASEDKNLPGMFAALKSKIRKLIITRADNPRALDPEQILEIARRAGLPVETVSPVDAALNRALELSETDGSIVLSAGSIFATAEALKAWNRISHT